MSEDVYMKLLEALKPFAHFARVMEEGQFLTFRGVYFSYEDAQDAAAAVAAAEEELNGV